MKTPLDVDARVGENANPNSKKREDLRRAQKRAEMDALSDSEANSQFTSIASNSLSDLEETGSRTLYNQSQKTQTERTTNRGFMSGIANYAQNLTRGKVKLSGKSSTAVVGLLIAGSTAFLTVLLTPSLAIVEMKEVLTQALNDQLHAVDSRSSSLFKASMKGPSACGAVEICKEFTTMSTNEVEQFEKQKSGIKIDRDMIDADSGTVKKISYTDDSGKTLEINNADELQSSLKDNISFKEAWTKGYNPQYKTLSDSLVSKVLYKLKATKNEDISGKNDEERQKNLEADVGGQEDSGAQTPREIKDENGNTEYVDENGNPVSQSDIDSAKSMESRIEKDIANGGEAGVLEKAATGALAIDGTADTACSVYNGMRHVSALAKIVKYAQLARYALALVLTPADKIKSGDANEGDTSFVGNTLMASSQDSQVLDESKLSQPANGKPPTTANTNIGNAFDSKGYLTASGETIGKLNSGDARFSLGGSGSTAVMDTVTRDIAKVVDGGNPDPKALSKKCGYIQSWFVRGGALAVGLITGAATFGVSTLVIGGASFAAQLAAPLVESQLGDIIAGDVVKDISGYDSGDAAYTGTAGLLGEVAQNRGMEPVTTGGGADYLAQNRQTTQQYATLASYTARATPFDINNRYSFLGSIAYSLVPVAWQSSTNASMAAMNMASLLPRSFASILQPSAGALSNNYFGQCDDQAYQSLGIQAGPFCEVRYWMSDQELAMDPAANSVWMAQTGNIDPNSPTGDPKDNKQDWNYVKFLDQCAHRTAGWGEAQDENGGGDGSSCLDPKYKDMNEHFSVYTMDQSLKQSMDEKDQSQLPLPGTTGFADGQTGQVGANGWAFPTPADDTITFGYEPGHEGVNIAGKDATITTGQPIFAAYDGTVVAAGPSQQYGNWIVLEHKVNGQTMSTVYAYMNTDGVLVHTGDIVKSGQEIGRIGNNGNGGQPYLYFELWQGEALNNGTKVDPTDILNAAQTKAGAKNA